MNVAHPIVATLFCYLFPFAALQRGNFTVMLVLKIDTFVESHNSKRITAKHIFIRSPFFFIRALRSFLLYLSVVSIYLIFIARKFYIDYKWCAPLTKHRKNAENFSNSNQNMVICLDWIPTDFVEQTFPIKLAQFIYRIYRKNSDNMHRFFLHLISTLPIRSNVFHIVGTHHNILHWYYIHDTSKEL